MQKVYVVYVQGWGDDEDEFAHCGAYSTRDKAEHAVETMLQGWESDGGDRADVVWDIEAMTVDA